VQFQIPQFIETESKIIGPFTLIGFFYLAGAGFACYLLFYLLELYLWFFVSAVLVGSALFLILAKVNGRPATSFLAAVFNYFWEPKVYVFQPDEKTLIDKPTPPRHATTLKDLLQKITVSASPISKREAAFLPELSQQQSQIKERYEILRKITGEKEMARRIDYR